MLNNCNLTWGQAVCACATLPGLTELRLCGNGLSSLQCDINGGVHRVLSQLQILDLEDNQLSSWDDIQQLRALPKLAMLLLSGNKLGDDVTYSGGFTALKSLMLGHNRIGSWTVADQLAAFPALHDVRLSDNPLTTSDPGTARYEAIARIPQLACLNGSAVSDGERWDAELAYLRHVTNQLGATAAAGAGGGGTATGGTKEQVLRLHPRYDALVAKYGRMMPVDATVNAGTALSASMAEVVLVLGGRRL